MQVGDPINDLVDQRNAASGGRGGLQPVRHFLNLLREAQINSAQPKNQHESEAPEADHAVQMPGQPLPSRAAMQRQAASPRLTTRPPDRQPRESNDEYGECTNTIDDSSGLSRQQIVVQIE